MHKNSNNTKTYTKRKGKRSYSSSSPSPSSHSSSTFPPVPPPPSSSNLLSSHSHDPYHDYSNQKRNQIVLRRNGTSDNYDRRGGRKESTSKIDVVNYQEYSYSNEVDGIYNTTTTNNNNGRNHTHKPLSPKIGNGSANATDNNPQSGSPYRNNDQNHKSNGIVSSNSCTPNLSRSKLISRNTSSPPRNPGGSSWEQKNRTSDTFDERFASQNLWNIHDSSFRYPQIVWNNNSPKKIQTMDQTLQGGNTKSSRLDQTVFEISGQGNVIKNEAKSKEEEDFRKARSICHTFRIKFAIFKEFLKSYTIFCKLKRGIKVLQGSSRRKEEQQKVTEQIQSLKEMKEIKENNLTGHYYSQILLYLNRIFGVAVVISSLILISLITFGAKKNIASLVISIAFSLGLLYNQTIETSSSSNLPINKDDVILNNNGMKSSFSNQKKFLNTLSNFRWENWQHDEFSRSEKENQSPLAPPWVDKLKTTAKDTAISTDPIYVYVEEDMWYDIITSKDGNYSNYHSIPLSSFKRKENREEKQYSMFYDEYYVDELKPEVGIWDNVDINDLFHTGLDIQTNEENLNVTELILNGSPRVHLMPKGYVPLDNIHETEFVGHIKVGTPGSTYNVVFDTGSANLWLLSDHLKTDDENSIHVDTDTYLNTKILPKNDNVNHEKRKLKGLDNDRNTFNLEETLIMTASPSSEIKSSITIAPERQSEKKQNKGNASWQKYMKNNIFKRTTSGQTHNGVDESQTVSQKNLYSHEDSSTHLLDSEMKKMNIKYGSGHVKGFYSYDAIEVGGLQLPKIQFGEATEAKDNEFGTLFGSSVKGEGILGLAFQEISEHAIPTLMDLLVEHEQISARIFSVFLSKNVGRPSSMLLLGKVNNRYALNNEIDYVPLSDKTFWSVEIEEFNVKYVKEEEEDDQAVEVQSRGDTTSLQLEIGEENEIIQDPNLEVEIDFGQAHDFKSLSYVPVNYLLNNVPSLRRQLKTEAHSMKVDSQDDQSIERKQEKKKGGISLKKLIPNLELSFWSFNNFISFLQNYANENESTIFTTSENEADNIGKPTAKAKEYLTKPLCRSILETQTDNQDDLEGGENHRRMFGIVDTGTSFLGIPADQIEMAFQSITSTLPKSQQERCIVLNNDMVSCPCSREMSEYPDLSIKLKGTIDNPSPIELLLHPEDYLLQSFNPFSLHYQCIISLQPVQSSILSDKKNSFILGTSLLKAYYTVFDAENSQIGFGRSIDKKMPIPSEDILWVCVLQYIFIFCYISLLFYLMTQCIVHIEYQKEEEIYSWSWSACWNSICYKTDETGSPSKLKNESCKSISTSTANLSIIDIGEGKETNSEKKGTLSRSNSSNSSSASIYNFYDDSTRELKDIYNKNDRKLINFPTGKNIVRSSSFQRTTGTGTATATAKVIETTDFGDVPPVASDLFKLSINMSLSQSLNLDALSESDHHLIPALNTDQKDLDKSVSSVSVSDSGRKDISGQSSLNFSSSGNDSSKMGISASLNFSSSSGEDFSSTTDSQKSSLLSKIPLPGTNFNISPNILESVNLITDKVKLNDQMKRSSIFNLNNLRIDVPSPNENVEKLEAEFGTLSIPAYYRPLPKKNLTSNQLHK